MHYHYNTNTRTRNSIAIFLTLLTSISSAAYIDMNYHYTNNTRTRNSIALLLILISISYDVLGITLLSSWLWFLFHQQHISIWIIIAIIMPVLGITLLSSWLRLLFHRHVSIWIITASRNNIAPVVTLISISSAARINKIITSTIILVLGITLLSSWLWLHLFHQHVSIWIIIAMIILILLGVVRCSGSDAIYHRRRK